MGIAAQCLHGAKVCVVPNPDNEYRPLALRHRPLALVSGLLIMAKILAIGLVALMPRPAELSTITTARIIQLTNQERAQAGLEELTVNDALSRAALNKAQDILDHDYFAHISPTGVTPWFWINNAGYTYRLAGENLAIDFVEAEDVVAAWMASPSHRDNLLQPNYLETGVGVLTGEFEGTNSTIVVHMFGQPSEGAAAPAQAPAATAQPPAVLAVENETPPAIPQLTLEGASAVGQEMAVLITSEANTTATILVNNQPREQVAIDASGEARIVLGLHDLPDGEIVLRAFAETDTGQRSELSSPQIARKDTTGPAVAPETISFIAAPQTDDPQALVVIKETDAASFKLARGAQETALANNVPVVLALNDTPVRLSALDENGNASVVSEAVLLPTFYAAPDSTNLRAGAELTDGVRKAALTVALLVAILLSLAVLIRIKIQRPGMIVHALFVLAVAATVLVL